jgi:hypothetical protein
MLPYSIKTVLSLFGYGCYLQHPFPGFRKVDLRHYSLTILYESPYVRSLNTPHDAAGQWMLLEWLLNGLLHGSIV